MNNKKIVHLVTPYLFHTGSWVYSQIKGVKSFEQYVFTQKKENLEQYPLSNIYSIDDYNFFIQLINKIYYKFAQKYGPFFKDYVKQIKPEVFHAHMGFEAVRWLDFIKKTKVPLITTFYGQDVSKLGKILYWQEKYQKLFDYGELFLAEGPFLKQQLVSLGCPEEKVKIQKLGVKIENYKQKEYNVKSPNSKFIILQVSTFKEKKGIEYSLEAISFLKEKKYNIEFRLVGAGEPEIEIEIKKRIKKLRIEEEVKLLGIRTHKETIEEMIRSDIFLHPSVMAEDGDNEGGSPVGITEASATGLPIVSTLHADIPSVVLDGKTGYLVEERNSLAISEKIIDLINNPQKMIKFGQDGRKHISIEYNQDLLMVSLDTIYKDVVKRSN